MTVVRTMNPKLDEEREFLGFSDAWETALDNISAREDVRRVMVHLVIVDPLPPMFDLFGGAQEDCPIVIVAIYVP